MIKETWTETEKGLVVAREQDVRGIADYCKARHNEGFHGSSDFKYVGALPVLVIEDYCTKQGVSFKEFHQNPEHLKRLMNDPAFSDLRVWKGTI